MLWLAFSQTDMDDRGYDEHLCPTTASGPSGLTVLLFDLTKPLAGLPPGSLGQLLREVTLEMERDTEIRAYSLTGSSNASRVLLTRLCKPFDSKAVKVATAKDHDGGTRDCDDLPAQMASDQRRSAFRFCELREAFESRLDHLAQNASERGWELAGAHLFEALGQTREDFLRHGGTQRVLHVVSDMMQHADWYSHLDLPSEAWDYDNYLRLRDSRHRLQGRWEAPADVDVHIHYMPREGLTAQPETGDFHRQFWRRFFSAERVTFHDQLPLGSYAWTPLMRPPSGGDAVRTAAAPLTIEEQVRTPDTEAAAEAGAPAVAEVEPVGEQPEPPAVAVAEPAAEQPEPPAVAEAEPAAEQPEPPTVAEAEPAVEQPEPPAVAEAEPVAEQPEPPAVAEAEPVAEEPEPPAVAEAGPPAEEPGQALIASPAFEDASGDSDEAGGDAQLGDAAQAQAVGTEVLECSEETLLRMLAQSGRQWHPEYPRGGFKDYGSAELALHFMVNDDGQVELEGSRVLEQESILERPGYFRLFANQTIAAIQDWFFPLENSEGRVCTPRASGYRIVIRF